MKVLHINEPFWSAWQAYGWTQGIPGIGIATAKVEEALKDKQKLYIKIGGDDTIYSISPVTVINLAKKYNSKRKVRSDVIVYVIPRNELLKPQNDSKSSFLLNERCKYCFEYHPLEYYESNFNKKHLIYRCNKKTQKIVYLPFVPNLKINTYKSKAQLKVEDLEKQTALF